MDKKCAVASAMNVKLSFLIDLLLTVLPLLARRDSSSFVFVHFCSSPSRHGVRCRLNAQEETYCCKDVRSRPLGASCKLLPVPPSRKVPLRMHWDGTAFTGPFQLQKTFINGTLRYGGTGRSSHDVSKGLERTSLKQFFSPCSFSPPTRQRLRGHSRCRILEDIHLWHFAVRGTERGFLVRLLQFFFPSGVPKGASSFIFVDFCSSPSRQVDFCSSQLFRVRESTRATVARWLSRTRHRRLPSGIGTKQTADGVTCQKSITNVSTTCIAVHSAVH